MSTCLLFARVPGPHSISPLRGTRLVLGLTNPIVPALRATMSEVCGPQHVIIGMAYLSSKWFPLYKDSILHNGVEVGYVACEPCGDRRFLNEVVLSE